MSNLLTAEVLNELTKKKGITVIVTVGNTMRSDDGVGSFIASHLKSIDNLKIIDAAYNPENIIDEVCDISPQRVIFIDAADFKGEPGEAILVDKDHIPETSLSTHAIPLKVVANLIEVDTKAVISYIGIQPKSVEFGEGLSEEIKKTAKEIIGKIEREFYHA
jgi:hydrogenase 3 maturation protease